VEAGYKGFPVTTVSEILSTDLVVNHPELRIGAVVTKVGDLSCDGLPLSMIAEFVAKAPRPVAIRFRDPSRYYLVIYIIYLSRLVIDLKLHQIF